MSTFFATTIDGNEHRATTQTRRFGRTDLQITPIGFGSWAIGGGSWESGWGPQDERAAIEAIRRAVALGVDWIDTAADDCLTIESSRSGFLLDPARPTLREEGSLRSSSRATRGSPRVTLRPLRSKLFSAFHYRER